MIETVAAMLDEDRQAPTAPLRDFLVEYAQDDNLPYRLPIGHVVNLLDAAIDQIEHLRSIDHLRAGTR